MVQKLFLHIGASKTGSSAVQQFLRNNYEYFSRNGTLIPDAQLGVEARVTGEQVFAFQRYITENDSNWLSAKLDVIKNTSANKVIMSAENLSNLGNHSAFQAMFDDFDTEVILYIRRQDELLTSSWQQWHSKVDSDFNAWLIKALKSVGHWDRVISDWESVVGAGKVQVRIFDRADMVDGDLISDFLHCVGISKSEELNTDLGNVNPSYSDLIVSLIAGNRSIFEGPHDNQFYRVVGQLTGQTYIEKKKVSLISRELRESIVAHYDAINRKVCMSYFPNRPRLFQHINHDKYQYLSEEELTRRQLQFITHLVYEIAKKGN